MGLYFVLVITISLNTASSELICTNKKHLLNVQTDKILQGTSFRNISTNGLLGCSMSCLCWRLCQSFNFNVYSGECQLNTDSLNSTSQLQTAAGFVFSDISTVPNRLAGSCAGHTCSLNSYCEPTGPNQHRCVVAGCLAAPGVDNGVFEASEKRVHPFGFVRTLSCDEGYAQEGDAVCQLNGTFSRPVCVPLTSCSKVQQFYPGSEDGEYWLSLTEQQYRSRIYCHNMTSSFPVEFLTLKTLNYGIYPRLRNQLCQEDHALDNSCKGRGGEIWFSKVRVDLSDLSAVTVVAKDFTFASINNSDFGLEFGVAVDCYTPHHGGELRCGVKGLFIVNLTGTGWRVGHDQQWETFGYLPYMMPVEREGNGTLVTLRCGGSQGGCRPKDGLFLMPSYEDIQI